MKRNARKNKTFQNKWKETRAKTKKGEESKNLKKNNKWKNGKKSETIFQKSQKSKNEKF